MSRSKRAEVRQQKERGPLLPPAYVAVEETEWRRRRIANAHQWALTEARPLEWVTPTTPDWLVFVLELEAAPGLLERLTRLGHMARFGEAKAQVEEQLLDLSLFEIRHLGAILESRMAEIEQMSWDLPDVGHTAASVLAWEGARSALHALELTGHSPQLQNLRECMWDLDTLFEGGPSLEVIKARGAMGYML